MDYLQTLEFRMASLQRKIRLLQDLRFFVETSSPEELAAFGDELRSVATSSGTTVGSVLAGLLGASAGQALPATEAPPSAEPRPIGEGGQGSATRRPALPEAALPEASAPSLSPSAATEPLPVVESVDVRALFEASMKAISAGSFLMGSEANDSEKPAHKVALSGFRVCDHLVTNKEYSLFVAANPKWSKDRADPELRDESYLSDWSDGACPEGKEDNPVAFVSFHAAAAFAAWAGKRLLTEAEWECAARGGHEKGIFLVGYEMIAYPEPTQGHPAHRLFRVVGLRAHRRRSRRRRPSWKSKSARTSTDSKTALRLRRGGRR